MSEDYARGIQTFKSLFTRYEHQELADSLPELPQGSVTSATGEVDATAPGSSHPPPSEGSLPDRAATQIENHEDLSTDMPPEEPMTDDNSALSGATTPSQDEPDTGISQMEAADIESELNNLLTIDDPSPSPSMVANPVTNLEPAATSSVQDLPADQPEE